MSSVRVEKVRKTLMKELSDIIRKSVKDPRVSGIVSITDIDLPNDFSIAKVYISIYGTETEKEQTLLALQENAPKVRFAIGKRIRLRNTPEIKFFFDNSLERGSEITALIDQISKGEIE